MIHQEACGTNGGYYRHRRRHEIPCSACMSAHRDNGAGRSAARQRAVSRLQKLFPDEWRILYHEELRREGLKGR